MNRGDSSVYWRWISFRGPSSRLYIIKYHFISSMNIFYYCTDTLFILCRMLEIGQSSRSGEEEPVFRDIHVDTEQLVGYAPLAPAQYESEEDEDDRAVMPEAVVGGVFRFDGEDTDDEDQDDDDAEDEPEEEETTVVAEADPEEGAEELPVGPGGYQDDMGTTADDIIDELTTHTVQLEERIAHLEGQNAVHQEREDQYRDLTHQREMESAELRQQLQQLRQERAADHRRLAEADHRRVQAEDRADQFRSERDGARTELQFLRDELRRTREDRDGYRAAWQTVAGRVGVLEEEVRTSASTIDSVSFALETALGRLRSRSGRHDDAFHRRGF